MRKSLRTMTRNPVTMATAYEDQSQGGNEELVIPDSFDQLSYDEVKGLYGQAVEAFDALYAEAGEGDLSSERVEALSSLTDGIEALASELGKRDEEAATRAEAAAELANRVKLSANTEDDQDDETDEADDTAEDSNDDTDNGDDDQDENTSEDEGAAETVTASGAAPRKEVRLPLSSLSRKAPKAPAKEEAAAPKMSDVVYAAGDGTGFAAGEGLDWNGVGKAVDRKLSSYNASQYASAASRGRHMREQHSIFAVRRDMPEDLTISSTDREHVDTVISRAVDESRLPGGGLVAAGGWCAPSETLYDLLELESRDGLLSLPEVGIARGGISFTTGPSFADIYSQIVGFSFTEENDINGEYEAGSDGNVVGPKPCYHIECPEFDEVRLEADGLCITAGLLQQRGYPEVIARTVRGALTAHEHRINANMIQRLVSGSTAVTLPTQQAGTAAPLLSAIELQVEHYKYAHRLSRGTTLEAVLPFWVRGAVRSDLSRRLGVELLSVSNSQIDGWFRERGINPQFVYNWQNLDTNTAGEFTSWPTEVTFLLYAAGTWVRGSSDIITLDTIYDSTLLAQNDYTALFTEEGWLVAKRGFDSRAVTVGIEADGATHMGIEIEHDGTKAEAPVEGGA